MQRYYRPDIDGLRAVAVLSVMIYHLNAAWLPGGFVGVDVFFVISGFVVTASLAKVDARALPGFVAGFYARRLARIVPALVWVLLVSSVLATMLIPSAWLSHTSQDTGKAAYFGLSNWVLQSNTDVYFSPRSEFNPYTHTWSLGVEEQFYVLAPLLVFLWRRQPWAGRWALAATTLASAGACLWASQHMPAAAFYFVGFRFWELGLGVLCYVFTQEARLGGWPARAGGMAWLGVGLLAAAFVWADPGHFPLPWAALPVLGTVLLIGGAQVQPVDRVRRGLAWPGMVWLGQRSYSLYLWHWPVYVLMRWTVGLESAWQYAAALAFTMVMGCLSYRYIEQPLRHPLRLARQPAWVWIGCFVWLPVAGYMVSKHVFKHPERYSLSVVSRHTDEWYAQGRMPATPAQERVCEVEVSIVPLAGGEVTRFTPKGCQKNVSTRQVFVLGDSHAGHLAPSLERLSAETGMSVRSYAFAGCSFLDLKNPMDEAHREPACLAFNRAASAEVAQMGQAGDVVLLSSLRMQRYGDQWASFHIADMYEQMHGPQARLMRQAATEDAKHWLQPLGAKGLRVVFVQPTPIFQAPAFRCSDAFNRMNPICVGNNQQTRAELERLRQPIVAQMREVARATPHVSLWDPFPVLCPGEVCHTSQEGHPLFFDGDHLSMYGNRVIYPALRQLLEGRREGNIKE